MAMAIFNQLKTRDLAHRNSHKFCEFAIFVDSTHIVAAALADATFHAILCWCKPTGVARAFARVEHLYVALRSVQLHSRTIADQNFSRLGRNRSAIGG